MKSEPIFIIYFQVSWINQSCCLVDYMRGVFFFFSFEDCCISVGFNYQKDIAGEVEPCDVLNNIN